MKLIQFIIAPLMLAILAAVAATFIMYQLLMLAPGMLPMTLIFAFGIAFELPVLLTELKAGLDAYLASTDSGFITGHQLVIDGGQLTF